MSKKKIIIISIITLIIAGVIMGIYIYKNKEREKILDENLRYNVSFSNVIDVFCVEGKVEGEKSDTEKKMTIKDYKINTKKLATKIYVYEQKNEKVTDLNSFYKNYKNDKHDLDEEASWLYGTICDIKDFLPEFQKELEQKQTEIEKIEEWLKNGELQKLEEWLSKQEF